MKGRNIMLAVLGAEFFTMLRVMPGRIIALVVFASLLIKQFIYQFVPLPHSLVVVLFLSTGLSALYVLLSLFSSKPGFDGGWSLMHVIFGASKRNAYRVVEPIIAGLIVLALVLPSVSFEQKSELDRLIEKNLPPSRTQPARVEGVSQFVPIWVAFGLTDLMVEPALFPDGTGFMWALVFLFIAWLGFALHAKFCDWPASDEYRDMLRRMREERDAASGRITFYSAGEPDGRE